MPRKSPKDIPAMAERMWQPGQSGNPKGRSKNPSMEELVTRVLGEEIPGTGTTKREALARVFVDEMLAKRNTQLIKEFLDRDWPKVNRVEIDALLDTMPASAEFVPTDDETREWLELDRDGGSVH